MARPDPLFIPEARDISEKKVSWLYSLSSFSYICYCNAHFHFFSSAPTRNELIKVDLWFPLRSIAMFFCALVALDRPGLIPALIFYLVAAGMFSVSYQRSKNPSPWKRCQVRAQYNVLEKLVWI